MVVLGIDPGTRRCGYGIVSRSGGRLARVDSGVLAPGDLPMAQRLARILEGIRAILGEGGIDAVAIETAYCGVSPRSALALGQARGIALAAAAAAGLPILELAPAEVKRAFTGNGRAGKAQMVRTARALFGVEPRLADEADALAIAVCCLARGTTASAFRVSAGRASSATSDRSATLDARRRLRPAVRRYGGI